MIETNRHRTEEAVEIDQPLSGDGIMNVGAAAVFEIEHDLEPIHQDVLAQAFQRVGGGTVRLGIEGLLWAERLRAEVRADSVSTGGILIR